MKLNQKIIVLISIQIILISTSFWVMTYWEMESSIAEKMAVDNAGKTRLLASLVQNELVKGLAEGGIQDDRVLGAMVELEENIRGLKDTMTDNGTVPLAPVHELQWQVLVDECARYENVVMGILEMEQAPSSDVIEKIEDASTRLIYQADIFTSNLSQDPSMRSDIVSLHLGLGIIDIITIALITAIIWRSIKVHTREMVNAEKFAAIGKVSTNIAHDMRNPLGTIRNSTALIEEQGASPPVRQETARINRAVWRMAHQIEGVLNYVRTVPLDSKPSSILDTLKQAASFIKITDNITLELPETDITIRCDAEKLEFVFVNLLLNAIQAIGKESREKITVSLERVDNTVILVFRNTGSSIPKKDITRVFEPLFTTKMHGTGLGLTGCKNIIEQHKGTITADSEDNIVTFTVRLPVG